MEPLEDPEDIQELREMIAQHWEATGSPRAREILEELENGSAPAGADVPIGPSSHDEQISLGDLGGQTVLNKLRMTDVNILSPIEALNLLAELKQDLNGD